MESELEELVTLDVMGAVSILLQIMKNLNFVGIVEPLLSNLIWIQFS